MKILLGIICLLFSVLPAVGTRWDGTLYDQTSLGRYWSSTQVNSSSGYFLYFSSSGSDPAYYDDKAYGFSVRCVKKYELKCEY